MSKNGEIDITLNASQGALLASRAGESWYASADQVDRCYTATTLAILQASANPGIMVGVSPECFERSSAQFEGLLSGWVESAYARCVRSDFRLTVYLFNGSTILIPRGVRSINGSGVGRVDLIIAEVCGLEAAARIPMLRRAILESSPFLVAGESGCEASRRSIVASQYRREMSQKSRLRL